MFFDIGVYLQNGETALNCTLVIRTATDKCIPIRVGSLG